MLSLVFASLQPNTISLTELNLAVLRQGWGQPQVNQSITEKPLTIAGQTYDQGLGTHSQMVLRLRLDGKVDRFTTLFGIDGGAGSKGSIRLLIYGDDRVLFRTPILTGGSEGVPVDVPLKGVRRLSIVVSGADDGIDFDHANLIEPTFHYSGRLPEPVRQFSNARHILTPLPKPEPRINAPALTAGRPGRPFIYRIPVQGHAPLSISAEGLPSSLSLDRETGIIRGTLPAKAGTYPLQITARNQFGLASQTLELVVGDRLALTPPMGWNPWYSHYNRVTQSKIERAADLFILSGLANVGYNYVSIDDCWMKHESDPPYRDAQGEILPNKDFPDMPALTRHIHNLGLRAGIYTSPGPWTCAKYVGSWQHEEQDAATFARWGFDLLKYDWCGYTAVATGEGLARAQRPYAKMGEILARQPRDILYNICQYGRDDVATWGASVGGHSWRTTDDLGWLGSFWQVALKNAELAQYAKPGEWNDPDYLLVGWIGDNNTMGTSRPVDLSADEQYSYVSLWSLMAAPLFFTGDIERLDPFTFNLLANPEIIAINQDRLGVQAKLERRSESEVVLVKPLADGSIAVGLFNRTEIPRMMRLTLPFNPGRALDAWTHRNVTVGQSLEKVIPANGCAVYRIWPKSD